MTLIVAVIALLIALLAGVELDDRTTSLPRGATPRVPSRSGRATGSRGGRRAAASLRMPPAGAPQPSR